MNWNRKMKRNWLEIINYIRQWHEMGVSFTSTNFHHLLLLIDKIFWICIQINIMSIKRKKKLFIKYEIKLSSNFRINEFFFSNLRVDFSSIWRLSKNKCIPSVVSLKLWIWWEVPRFQSKDCLSELLEIESERNPQNP